MYDIIIVGAGPAGLTAALYAGRANKKVLVLEAKAYGGQIINTPKIENYPGIPNISGFELATNLYNQVVSLGIEVKLEKVIRIEEDKVITNESEYETKAIILATGAENRKLNLPKEEKLVGKGISYCATCDGAFYKEKIVAVNGGGNTALEDAIYLSNIAKKVYLIHRRDSFRGEHKYIEEALKKENVEVIYNSTITKLIGDNKLTQIEVTNKENEIKTIDVNGLFIAIGQTPKNEYFKNIIELNEEGYIISEDGVHTTKENIYVAGDTRVKELRQLTTAISDGAIAATTAIKEMED